MRRPIYCLVIASLFSLVSIQAQTEWTGAAAPDNSWYNPTNWDNGLPGPGNDATIPITGFVDLTVQSSDLTLNFNIINNGLLFFSLGGFDVINQGSIVNNGLISVTGGSVGAFYNESSISNHGSFYIAPCATLVAEDGSALANAGAGTFANDGILYIIGAAIANVTSGSGITLYDISDNPAPDMQCLGTYTVTLDQFNQALINPSDIDNGSSADYCTIAAMIVTPSLLDCDNVGIVDVTLKVTDGLGYAATCTTTVTVIDPVAPIINCPIEVHVDLDPGECEGLVEFNISATDNCVDPSITQTDNSNYSSGDIYPIGATYTSFQASDGANISFCEFYVYVNEYTPPNSALSCNDDLNISISSNCDAIIEPDVILEGEYGCYDEFMVEIDNTNNNYINYSYVGQTITITVTSNETGNSCWGEAVVEDKLAPAITNCDSVFINCLMDPLPFIDGGDVGVPNFDDCSSYDSYYVDNMITGGCFDDFVMGIVRVWTVTDYYGNVNTCEQAITVDRISLEDYTPSCAQNIDVECALGVTADLSPASVGYPTINVGGQIYPIKDEPDGICTLTAIYEDDTLSHCGGGFKIIRSWTIADWCLPFNLIDNPWTCIQEINYKDHTPPTITPPNNYAISTATDDCGEMPILPPATVFDCSGYTVTTVTPVGPISGNGGEVPYPGLGLGTHTITYKATDDCGNFSTVDMEITIGDEVIPYMVCELLTSAAINTVGDAYVYAPSFDNGSFDNCCMDQILVRRMESGCGDPLNTTFRPFVYFCCEDVHETHAVVVRAIDCYGNYNECMVQIQIEDNIEPGLTCPQNVTLGCGDDFNNLNATGVVATSVFNQNPGDGIAFDNCNFLDVSYHDAGSLNCGQGSIARTWQVTDLGGSTVSCVQTISVLDGTPFDGSGIQWPVDANVTGCNSLTLPNLTGEPLLPASGDCSTLVLNYSDEVFYDVPDVCLKTLRSWVLIDWCQYDPNVPLAGGRWEYVQTIKVIDNVAPVLTNCDNKTFCNFSADCNPITADLTISAFDDCTDGVDLIVNWSVDQFNDGVIDAGSAFSGNGQNLTNSYPIGTHSITYEIHDDCGNVSACSFSFSVVDCRAPAVFCEGGINIELDQNGEASIVPELIEEGSSSDNCSPDSELVYSFSSNLNHTLITYGCNQIGNNQVELWVTDEAGNQDYCTAIVNVQDNNNFCNGDSLVVNVGGYIGTEENEGIENVEVNISSTNIFTTLTNDQGSYMFPDLPMGYDYSISPFLNDDPLNGVTTFDLVLIGRHILGISTLDSPYKIIAADVNHSETITSADMLDIRKVILQITPNFPNNNSWRFVEESHVFPNPSNPFIPAFPEIHSINNISANSTEADFMAIKIGDLNGTAVGSNLHDAEDRGFDGEFLLTVDNKSLKAGETVTIDFTAQNLNEILGCQFTLNFDNSKLEFVEIEGGDKVSNENFGLVLLEEGAITTSWNHLAESANEGSNDEVLFGLTFRVKSDALLSDLLNINSRFTAAEAYSTTEERLDVDLQFNQTNGLVLEAENFTLYQNNPNPFKEATSIGFNLPEAGTATLTIYDLSGKTLKSVTQDFAKGYNELNVIHTELQGSGIFYYRLDTPSHTATRKMVLVGH